MSAPRRRTHWRMATPGLSSQRASGWQEFPQVRGACMRRGESPRPLMPMGSSSYTAQGEHLCRTITAPGKSWLLIIVHYSGITERKRKELVFSVCLLCAWHCVRFTYIMPFHSWSNSVEEVEEEEEEEDGDGHDAQGWVIISNGLWELMKIAYFIFPQLVSGRARELTQFYLTKR